MYDNPVKSWYDYFRMSNNMWKLVCEFGKYCRADAEVLNKSILPFRQIFNEGLDIDQFSNTSLGSLCMNIVRGKIMPATTLVSIENNMNDSRV